MNNDVIVEAGEKSVSRILKSTALIGGSNVIGTALRIIRTKVFAILLGPAGMGLVGLYSSVMTTTTALSEMGVGSSGVREVAEASGDETRMSGTLFCLRSVTLVLGALGALVLLVLSKTLSLRIFGNTLYAVPLAVLSLGVLFQIISDSQMALLNGLRRVGDLARIYVMSSLIGTILAVIVVWVKGESAIAWATVFPVLATLTCSWWFVKNLRFQRRRLPWRDMKAGVISLLRIGVAFMIAGLAMTAALLFTRLIFIERLGLAATGLFQAAWGIAVTNIDFILTAMGIDYYPHLTSCVTKDQSSGTRLVNEQTEVALLLGGPAIIGMLVFSGPLIHLFFSNRFILATGLLRWLVLGSVLKLVSWPLSFLILAEGWAVPYFLTELLWCVTYVSLVYLGSSHVGLMSAGYAFVAAYLLYTLAVYAVTHFRSGFRWTVFNLRLAGVELVGGLVLIDLMSRNAMTAYCVGAIGALAFGLFSARRLYVRADNPAAKRFVLSLRRKLNFAKLDAEGPI